MTTGPAAPAAAMADSLLASLAPPPPPPPLPPSSAAALASDPEPAIRHHRDGSGDRESTDRDHGYRRESRRDSDRERDRERDRDRGRGRRRTPDRDSAATEYDPFADAEESSSRKRQRTDRQSSSSQRQQSDDPGHWVYLDQHGAQQGPFSTAEIHGWYVGGFFQGSLQVRPAAGGSSSFGNLDSFPWLIGASKRSVDGDGEEGCAGKPSTRGPLPDQSSMFGESQVAAIEAGGVAQSARGQALFLQQKLQAFELAGGSKDSEAAVQHTSAAKPSSLSFGAKKSKPKSGGGGFMGMLKQQVTKTEKAQQRGASGASLSLDAVEKQGDNSAVFKYLLPPMGH
jgi:hypothetical protein